MIQLALIPWHLKLIAIAVAIAAVGAVGYFKGRESVRSAWEAERAEVKAAAAKARGQQEERERMWQEALKTAGAKYEERNRVADRSFNAGLDSLRNAYASRDRVRADPEAPRSSEEASRPTAAELLGKGEELARLVHEADRDRAALMACVEAFPR